ncbi:MAG: DNA-processing protein DprA [Clostridia bacterium]|nr:DNA-processing protein DprA [Clostridia bacterium]
MTSKNFQNITIEYIIKLLHLPKIGRKTAKKIINKLSCKISNDSDLFNFISEIRDELRLPIYSEKDKNNVNSKWSEIIEESDKHDIKIISYMDAEYPKNLLKIDDFPLILNCKGDLLSINNKPNVAIIGTRKPTNFGFELGMRLGQVFSENGYNIVSGLALGCDTAGHKGALSNGNTTTAVLAHGLDSLYPKENQKLSNDIIEKGGLLLSEYFVKQRPVNNFFIERDRIQAGLSECLIVVETDIKGGTMHTVKYCLNYSRILACINYPEKFIIENPSVKGNKYLLDEKKAIPIFSKSDIESLIIKLRINNNCTANKNIIKNNTRDTERKIIKNFMPIQLRLWG